MMGGGAKKRRASWAPVRIGGLVGPGERIFTAGASLTLAPGNEEDPLCMAPWKGRSYCQGWTLGGGAGEEDPLAYSVRKIHSGWPWKGWSFC